MEVAPADMDTDLEWASSEFCDADITGTVNGIGIGKKNTALILAADADAPAAKACDDYSNGGKTDWFLPNLSELFKLYSTKDSLYDNFVNAYWSSQQQSSNVSGASFLISTSVRQAVSIRISAAAPCVQFGLFKGVSA